VSSSTVAFFAVMAVVSGCLLGVGDHGPCSESLCGGNRFRMTGKAVLPEQVYLRVCRNGDCTSKLVVTDVRSFSRVVTDNWSATIQANDLVQPTAVAVMYVVGKETAKDGDLYSLEITERDGVDAGAGEVYVDAEWLADYKRISANNGVCDDSNSVYCLQAQVDF
jgi:hypothetical protein